MNSREIIRQIKPKWCLYPDCLFLRNAQNLFCAGQLPKPLEHDSAFNTHRLCMRAPSYSGGHIVSDYQVNVNDLDWFRWVIDAIDVMARRRH